MGRPKKRDRSVERPHIDANTRRRKAGASDQNKSQNAIISDSPAVQQEQHEEPQQDISATYDMGSYASAFTASGSLQPWLQQGFPEDTTTPWYLPTSDNVPALTPDNNSLSPPDEASSLPTTDTLQLGAPIPCKTLTITSCACLSTLYLTLSTLNNMKTASDFSFPAALHPLREAMSSTQIVLACEECPKSFNTGLQNTTMLGTLFLSIAERYSKVLEHIDLEFQRAEKEGEWKRFRLTDLNGENGRRLHLGGEGCAAAFSLDLSPAEWKAMCKKVVRAEVMGSGVDGDGKGEHEEPVYFLGLARQMEERQNRWHKMPLPEDFPKGARGIMRPESRHAPGEKEEHHCLKMVGSSKSLVEGFDWS